VFAIQLAKQQGAEVTAVDNTGKRDLMRSLGADHVVDYTREDFTRSGKQYDLILDLVAHRPARAYPRALKPGGSCFFVGGSVATLFQILLLGPWVRRATGKDLRLLVVQTNRKDLETVAALCVEGRLNLPMEQRQSLSAVPEALRALGEGRVQGKLVISMAPDHPAR
jgi:NADPH:quinone reductase-like Zn-dependent oxidoreductase